MDRRGRKRGRLGVWIRGAVSTLLFALLPLSPAIAATFTVDDLGDASDASAGNGTCATAGSVCTLRAAIEEANAAAGADTINFSVTGTIDPASTYNLNTNGSITIDGGANHDVAIDGTGTSGIHCFTITTASNVIKGLVIKNCNYGIYINNAAATGNKIQNNYLGTDTTGNAISSSANSTSIRLNSGGSNVIGTDGDGANDSSEGNVITCGVANVYCVNVLTSSNTIAGNKIGVGADGTTDLGVGGYGVTISGNSNIVGTNGDGVSDTDERNIISGWNEDSTSYGIYVDSGSSNRIAGNYIGTTSTGNAALINTYGIYLNGGSGTIIGTNGDTAYGNSGNDYYNANERNVIVGSTDSITLTSSSSTTTVAGNYIGIGADGSADLGSGGNGIAVYSANTVVGTNADGTSDTIERNVISWHDAASKAGVYLNTASATGVKVMGNYIGTDSAGTAAKKNTYGVYVTNSAASNIIGTNGDGTNDSIEGNVISGNSSYGVYVTTASNTIAGNYIGTGADGTTDLGNGGHGIWISNVASNTVGGNIAAEENLIRYNGDAAGEYGINISGAGATSTSLQRNRIYDNQVEPYNVANNSTTAPSGATSSAGTAAGEIKVTMNSTAGYTVYAFSDTDGDGNCEAQSYLGAPTDNGDGTFTYTTSGLSIGNKVGFNAYTAGSNTSTITCYSLVDLAPVLDAVGNKSVNEVANLNFTVTRFEPNAEDAAATLSCSNDNAAAIAANVCQYFTAATGAFSWTPSYTQSGSYQVTFTATDASDGALTDTEQITITVSNTDTTPSLADPGAKSVAEGATLSFTLSGSDTDGDTLTYSCSANCPSGLSVNGGTGEVSWTPGYAAAASSPYNNVTFRVADPQANAATRAITITVTNTDTTPSLADPGAKSVAEAGTLSFSLSGSDADGDTLSYSCSANCPSGLSVNSSTGAVSWTPGYTAAASSPYANVTFRAADPQANAATRAITITVTNTDTTPTLADPGNQSVQAAGTLTFALSGSDTDGDSLTYSCSANCPTGLSVNGSTGAVTWTPTVDQAGAYSPTFRVADPQNNADTQIVAITVDPAPSLSIADTTVTEDSGTATITVTMDIASVVDVTVDYATTAGGTATASNDYAAANGTLTWTAGQSGAKTFTVPVVNDDRDEPDETVNLQLSNASNAVVGTSSASLTLTDNDATPTIAVSDTTVVEADGAATVTVTMTGASASTVTVAYATTDGAALAPSDYTATTGTLSWSPGETGAKTFSVSVIPDDLDESDETLSVALSNPSNAAISDGSGTVTVTDDDTAADDDDGEEPADDGEDEESGDDQGEDNAVESTTNDDGSRVDIETLTDRLIGTLGGTDVVETRVTDDHGNERTRLGVGGTGLLLPEEPDNDYTVETTGDRRLVVSIGGCVYISTAPFDRLPPNMDLDELDCATDGASSALAVTSPSEEGLAGAAGVPVKRQVSDYFVALSGNRPDDEFGKYTTTADVNGDGTDEVLISAPSAARYGVIYVYDSSNYLVATIFGSPDYPISSVLQGEMLEEAGIDLLFGPDNEAMRPNLQNASALAATRTIPEAGLLSGPVDFNETIDLSEVEMDAHLNAGGNYQAMAVGDFDGDGVPDLVLTAENGYSSLFFGSSLREHSNASEDFYLDGSSIASFGRMIACGDVNGDGLDDILFGAPEAGDGGKIYVVLGRTRWETGGEFEGVIKIAGDAGEGIGADLVVADSDGDGATEILTMTSDGSVLRIKVTAATPASNASSGGCSLMP